MADPVRKLSRKANARGVGELVLAGLAKGRNAVNSARKRQARATRHIVEALAIEDAKAGFPSRGRAERIAKKLKGKLGRSTVYRHYSELFSAGQNP